MLPDRQMAASKENYFGTAEIAPLHSSWVTALRRLTELLACLGPMPEPKEGVRVEEKDQCRHALSSHSK